LSTHAFAHASHRPCRSAPCARQPFASVATSHRPGGGRDPVSSVFGCGDIANGPLTQRAFRSPAGDAKLVPVGRRAASPWEARVTFLLLAHARALGVRTAKPAQRVEGASPESKKSNPKKTAFRARARSDMRDRSVGVPRPVRIRSLLPHTKPLHRNAPIRRGLKARFRITTAWASRNYVLASSLTTVVA